MLKLFKDLSKEEQFEILLNQILNIKLRCEERNNKKDKLDFELFLNSLPLLIDNIINFIYISKLSEKEKTTLIIYINEIYNSKKNKTR